jgi:hypothetical protein
MLIRILAILLLPGLFLFGLAWLVLHAGRVMRGLDRRLRTRGIVRLLARGEERHCRAGVVGGVGIRVDLLVPHDETPDDVMGWHTVRASRDSTLVHAGLDLPETAPAEDAGYLSKGPLDADQSEAAAKAALEDLPQKGVELRREGELVEVRIACDLKPEVIDRVIDIACSWVDGKQPAPAPKVTLEKPSLIGVYAAMLAVVVGFAISSLAIVHSDSFARLLEHVCDPGDRLIVHEDKDRGGGFNWHCRTQTGETYGCTAITAAGFDVMFPLSYAVIFTGFVLRRRRASKRMTLDGS